jgi:hypothetical protein
LSSSAVAVPNTAQTAYRDQTYNRVHRDTFDVTQESIALMLGVRRVGITQAATGLQRRGIIEYVRGEVTVLNRKALEQAACSCYAADRRCYSKYL